MGQVISGQKKDAAGQPVPGTQFGYAYDGIGNRTSATVNGRTGTYTADAANQYTQRQVPGAVDIRGSASPAAKVTVNGQNTQRLGDSFYKALTVDNSAAPQYPGVSVLAVRQAAGPTGEDVKSETLGNLFLAKTPELFTHDAEGNLTADGRWSYTWDGENRLIRMETIAAVPAAAKRKLDFAYDAHSRRIRKQVSTWNGSAWVVESDRRYLYDGWNLVAELDAANTMLRTYTWGLDLSRSPQGAGGVGGLLAIHEAGESYLPAYDGNGNVMALVKASDESIAARYEYGPFGETLVAQESGISNPFRFSTKFQDGESGLYYYGIRFYDPVTGGWPSRDRIGEDGGANLYGFLNNNAIVRFDILGMVGYGGYSWTYGEWGEWRQMHGHWVNTSAQIVCDGNMGEVNFNVQVSASLSLGALFNVGMGEDFEVSLGFEIGVAVSMGCTLQCPGGDADCKCYRGQYRVRWQQRERSVTGQYFGTWVPGVQTTVTGTDYDYKDWRIEFRQVEIDCESQEVIERPSAPQEGNDGNSSPNQSESSSSMTEEDYLREAIRHAYSDHPGFDR
jgi:RHS repeat-associated protein